MKTFRSKVICDGCMEEFNIYTNDSEAKDWYVDKPLKNCKAHTKKDTRSTIHKHLRPKKSKGGK